MEVLYKGTVEERVHLIFALYDVTGKGRITKVEMKMASYMNHNPSYTLPTEGGLGHSLSAVNITSTRIIAFHLAHLQQTRCC